MAAISGINWTDSSFAPWRGCQNVSPACARCYAERIDKRAGLGAAWGPHGTRRRTSPAYWRQPLRWQAEAARTGQPRRVFASHLSDVFDNRADAGWRADLWQLVRDTPALTWMVLTKRPQNIAPMLPPDWGGGWANVWLGVTAEDQAEAARRLPGLLAIPAAVRWISAEPLLAPLDLRPWLGWHAISWVIAGGESGGGARPMHPAWARRLRDQCAASGAAFWMKQTGGNRANWPGMSGKGDDITQWPEGSTGPAIAAMKRRSFSCVRAGPARVPRGPAPSPCASSRAAGRAGRAARLPGAARAARPGAARRGARCPGVRRAGCACAA